MLQTGLFLSFLCSPEKEIHGNSKVGFPSSVHIFYSHPSDDDTIRILIATDNHLGYLEKDPIRGNDSFISFEEILQKAKEQKVRILPECYIQIIGGLYFVRWRSIP